MTPPIIPNGRYVMYYTDTQDVSISRLGKNVSRRHTFLIFQYAYALSEDSDQPAHQRNLIRVFTGYSQGSQGTKAHSDSNQIAQIFASPCVSSASR